jgi:hypothetical protein
MQSHVSMEELLRFRDGSADAGQAVAVGRHLGECDRCAALADEVFGDEALPTITSSLREEQPARLPWIVGIAAAVAAAIAAAVVYFAMNRPAAPQRQPPTASLGTAAPGGYGRAGWDALVRDALARGRVAIAAPAGDSGRDVLRGAASGAAGAMTPSATAVESAQPELRWPAIRGATFVVSIVAGDDVVARSPALEQNRWTPATPLRRGRTYAWQVRVTRGDKIETLPPPPRANPQFRVLGDDEVRDLVAARRGHPSDHLLLGVLAAHFGLRDEAHRELAQFAAEHPGKVLVP